MPLWSARGQHCAASSKGKDNCFLGNALSQTHDSDTVTISVYFTAHCVICQFLDVQVCAVSFLLLVAPLAVALKQIGYSSGSDEHLRLCM